MDPIVSPTGQRVLSHPGEVSPFGPHSQPSVFSWVSMRVYVCFPAKCVHECVSLQVHVCVNVCLRGLITTATALFDCSFPFSM